MIQYQYIKISYISITINKHFKNEIRKTIQFVITPKKDNT